MAWVDVGGLEPGTDLPNNTDNYLPVRSVPQHRDNYSFSDTIASGVQSYFTLLRLGAGSTVSQSGGNLVLAAGTTARSETIIRSNKTWNDALTWRWAAALSQRIANNNFIVELVDVIGDNLAYTITSATSVTVTIPSNPFTAANVGQSVYVGNFNGTGTFLSERYPIASVSGNDVTFTVSGFAAGSGTCSLWGWNYLQAVYNGTTATTMLVNSQRKGWWKGTATSATITSTASPGHIGIVNVEDGTFAVFDQSPVGGGTVQTNSRAGWFGSIPDGDCNLYLQIRSVNGTTAPASNTSLTLGFAMVENYAPSQVSITSARVQSLNTGLPVNVVAMPTTTVSGSLTSAGTVTNTPATPTSYNVVTTASTNAAVVKATAGTLYEITVSNVTATPVFVKLYNKATAPTVGTDVPILTIPAAAGATAVVALPPLGKRFGTGIGIAATAAAAATDTGVAVAGVQINASYI